jgi:hypothetical protein
MDCGNDGQRGKYAFHDLSYLGESSPGPGRFITGAISTLRRGRPLVSSIRIKKIDSRAEA